MNNNLVDLLDRLNPDQKAAAENLTGPELIVAGAGSGKTSVLTARTALLLERGVIPERILALTFTKKAAGEMRERIVSLAGEEAKRLTMGTFHSVFIRFLRPYAHYLNFPAGFTVSDEDDSERRLKRSIKEVLASHRPPQETWNEERKKAYKAEDKNYKVRDIASLISHHKNALVTAWEYAQNPEWTSKDAFLKRPYFAEIFVNYATACFNQGVMDFDDILLYTDILMSNWPEVRREIAAGFDYIMIDEYQDTNVAQYSIMHRLVEDEKAPNLCVVGDDSQSIYAFRGARIENIFNFKRDFPDLKVFYLRQNYRSTKTIVEAANRLIAHNAMRIPKDCFSTDEVGEDIYIDELRDERAEAAHVAEEILRRRKDGCEWTDFAVLYRTNAQSRAIEEAMVKRAIPYVVYSGTSFFERTEVKDQLCFLKLAVNPDDDEAFRRVANKPVRGLGDAALEKLTQFARAHGLTLWKALQSPEFLLAGFPPTMYKGLEEFKDIIDEGIVAAQRETAYDAATVIMNACRLYDDYMEEGSDESVDRANNIVELINAAKSFEEDVDAENAAFGEKKHEKDLTSFLESVALLSNADTDGGKGPKVSVMTVHCSKGLEFKHVYITGMEEFLFPLSIDNSDSEEEEERRLFYVAVTRAKKTVLLTRAQTRLKFGSRNKTKESHFVAELFGEDLQKDEN